MPTLRARDHGELLRLGRRRALHHLANAARVDRHRLLHEDVLAAGHGRFEVLGAEPRRRREDHHVAVGPDHALKGIEADELPRLGNIHPGPVALQRDCRDCLAAGPSGKRSPIA